MSISTLCWFVELASTDPSAPNCAIGLSLELKPAVDEVLDPKLQPKNTKQKINRIFDRYSPSLTTIAKWFRDSAMQAKIDAGNNQRIKSAYKESKIAIAEIISGTPASQAWEIGRKRGATTGFSKTFEAAALVGYLTKEKEFNFSKNEAVEKAAAILELNPDEIRRYKALSAISDESEAAIAFSAIARNNKIKFADRHFDIEVLQSASTNNYCHDLPPVPP